MPHLTKHKLISAAIILLLSAASIAASSGSLKNANPMPAGTRVIVHGHAVTLPRAWPHMTIADLARLGIHPGMGEQADDFPPSVRDNDMPAGSRIALPNGRHVKLPKSWIQMTISDLAEIGIHPGMGPRVVDTHAATRTFRPDSASSCDLEVCIYVTGGGLTVNSWETTGDYDGQTPVCTYAVYWAPSNTVYATGTAVCGGDGLYYGYDKDTPIIWGTAITICNTWVEMYGKSCVGVHSS
jgi:hypothetical protein